MTQILRKLEPGFERVFLCQDFLYKETLKKKILST